MQTNYTYYLNLAARDYLISTNDRLLAKYFVENFFLSKTVNEKGLKIRIKKNRDGYIFENRQGHCLKKILFSEIDKVHYWEHLDFILMLLINSFSLSDNTLLFHGAAYAKNGKGYIFLGPTGAGKSTVTKKVSKKYLYADDTVVVNKKQNNFFLYSSPFDKKKILAKNIKPVPVYKIYILNQSKKNKVENLKIEEKLTAVLSGLLLVEGCSLVKQNNQKKLYSLTFDLINKTKVNHLFFTKNFNPYKNLF